MVNVDRSTISRVESGETALTQDFLVRLAAAFNVPPRALVEVDPSAPGGDDFAKLMRSWQRLTPERRAEILRIIAALDPPAEP